MKIILVTVIAIIIAAFTDDSHAIDAKLTWKRPTMRENGVALPADQIKQYEIEYVNLSTMARKKKLVSGTYQGYTVVGLLQSSYGFRIRVYDVGGLVSKWSNQVISTVTVENSTVPIKMCECQ